MNDFTYTAKPVLTVTSIQWSLSTLPNIFFITLIDSNQSAIGKKVHMLKCPACLLTIDFMLIVLNTNINLNKKMKSISDKPSQKYIYILQAFHGTHQI